METIKVAVIGLGNISAEHIRAYQNDPRVQLYALCSRNLEKAGALAKRYGVPHIYSDPATMFRELPELDAVSICSWNAAHMDHTLQALQAGCHVLCEKPMALNAQQAEYMAQVARDRGKLLMVGFVCRFKNSSQLLEKMIREGRLGEIYYGRAQFIRKDGSPGGWFTQREHSGGGPLIDLGVHIIDLARYLCGNPKPVSVYGAVFDSLRKARGFPEEIFNVEDMAAATIRYDNGVVISVETSFCMHTQENRFCVELYGTKGCARLTDKLEFFEIGTDGCTQCLIPASDDRVFERQEAHFVDCILNAAACIASAEDGVISMQTIDGIYRSAQTGRDVLLCDSQ